MREEISFEELQIRRIARELVKEVYCRCPEVGNKDFNEYMRRVSWAVLCNIVEGHTGSSLKEFKFFMKMALKGCEEMLNMLEMARVRSYLEGNSIEKLAYLCKGMCLEIGRVIRKRGRKQRRLTFNDEV